MSEGKWYVSLGFVLQPKNMSKWNELQQKLVTMKLNRLSAQHCITATKIELARIHLGNLALMLPSGKVTDLTPVSRNIDNSLTFEVPNLTKLLPFITEYEAFLFSLTSAFDCFLAQLNKICTLEIPDREVTLKKVREKISKKFDSEDELARYILAVYNAKWFRYLGDLRNLSAHQVIPFPVLDNNLRLYLPAKPKVIEPNFIVEYVDFFAQLNGLLDKMESWLNFGYGLILTLI